MATDGPMVMSIDMENDLKTDMKPETPLSVQQSLLILQNWFSPAFPIGAFSYSAGLETAIAREDVTDCDSLADWLRVALLQGPAFNDAVLLCAAYDGEAVNDLCLALCAGAERHQETTELGAAFANLMRETQGLEIADGLGYPVAVGIAARNFGIAVEATVAAFLQSICMQQISVAVRTVPIGQMEGQRCLLALIPSLEAAIAKALATDTDAIGGFALGADLCALEHETASQRIYRT